MYMLLVAVGSVLAARCGESALLYPRSTVLQMIGSVSVPINDLVPLQKVSFDWGFQMNYDMPYNLSSFYMVPIWSSRGHVPRSGRDLQMQDYTFDEIYVGLENSLEEWGFHRTCLKRSICELAQHPLEATHLSLLTDLVMYILTPSLIDVPPSAQHSNYTMAENQGHLEHKCHQQYPECIDDLLSIFTKIDH